MATSLQRLVKAILGKNDQQFLDWLTQSYNKDEESYIRQLNYIRASYDKSLTMTDLSNMVEYFSGPTELVQGYVKVASIMSGEDLYTLYREATDIAVSDLSSWHVLTIHKDEGDVYVDHINLVQTDRTERETELKHKLTDYGMVIKWYNPYHLPQKKWFKPHPKHPKA